MKHMVETHLKNNYVDWLPLKKGEALLCVSENMDNLEGMWDYLAVADAFAKVPEIFGGTHPYQQFFEQVKKHLKPNGHLILAVDNRYGLSFFAGCKEPFTGWYFEGLEGYENSEGVCTFSKEAVLEMAKEAGFEFAKTYYPYPNYRYMTAMYTDAHLPALGELHRNLYNFEEERLVLFDESKVFDELIKEGRFQEFSNSYLFDLTMREKEQEEDLLYVKYSVERAEKYRIRTEIVRTSDGTKVVRKVPYTESARSHVEKIKHWEEVLKKQYESEAVSVNRCTVTEQGVEFEFLKGKTLEHLLDEYLEEGNLTAFVEEVKRYADKVKALMSAEKKAKNIDLIFSNIILKDDKWNVIDYEWTFEAEVPVKFVVYRSLVLYFEQKKQKSLQCKQICELLGITEKEQKEFSEMEHELQKYLLGDTKTMDALQLEYAGKVMDLSQILKKAHQPEMKIYEDFGQGFSEVNSYVLEAEEDFYGRRRFTLALAPNVIALRLDPCEESCVVTVNRLLGECGGTYELTVGHNGKAYEKSILYTTNDPQLVMTGIVPGTSQIHVDLTVEYLKEETSYLWMEMLQKAEKCDRIEASKPYRLMKKIKSLVKKG